MKTGVSLSVFPAAPGMPALFSADLENSVRVIKELGYDGVDLFVLEPDAPETILAKRLLREHGLSVAMLMPAALAKAGLFLGHAEREVREATLRRLEPIVDLAGELGALVSVGLIRGSAGKDGNRDEFFDRFAGSCERLLGMAGRRGVRLALEPINRYEIDTLNTSLEALEFIEKTGLDLGLLLDTFHMNIEDASLAESFRRCAGRTAHIHFLDSNRLAPGMGHLDMAGLYDLIATTGYSGYLCLEALARPDSLTCARNGAAFFAERRGNGGA